MNLQRVAELYEGEQHFIFFDNVAAFQSYISDHKIRKFITGFTDELQKLNLYGFFMVPKGTINVSLRDTLQSIPSLISNKLNLWNK